MQHPDHQNPDDFTSLAHLVVPENRVAKVKALDPLMSTNAPSLAKVIACDAHKAKVRAGRYLAIGTLVQLHIEGEFSLWIVRKCAQDGVSFFLDLELAELVSAH